MTSTFIICAILASPKGLEAFSGTQMQRTSIAIPALAPQEDTNSVISINLSWNHSQAADSFIVYYGSSPRTYTNKMNVGRANSCVFCKTNWPEESVRHFYAVTATVAGMESDYSNEAFWPLYPADRIEISWPESGRADIKSSRDLKAWAMFTNAISPVTLPISSGSYYSSTNRIKIKAINPLNP